MPLTALTTAFTVKNICTHEALSAELFVYCLLLMIFNDLDLLDEMESLNKASRVLWILLAQKTLFVPDFIVRYFICPQNWL